MKYLEFQDELVSGVEYFKMQVKSGYFFQGGTDVL
jgi:hypothetical protein